MSKAPSDATLLRQARRDIKELQSELDATRMAQTVFRQRATKAEQDCAEWKARFDLLLRQPAQTRGPDYCKPITPSSADPLPALPTITCKEQT